MGGSIVERLHQYRATLASMDASQPILVYNIPERGEFILLQTGLNRTVVGLSHLFFNTGFRFGCILPEDLITQINFYDEMMINHHFGNETLCVVPGKLKTDFYIGSDGIVANIHEPHKIGSLEYFSFTGKIWIFIMTLRNRNFRLLFRSYNKIMDDAKKS